MHEKTSPEYWNTYFPETVYALSRLGTSLGWVTQTLEEVSENLAYIAGDYANMPDDDIIATYINDSI